VSWFSLIGSVYFYIKIIKRLFGLKDNQEALRGLMFFILFPTAVFLLATYTESLFAFLALGSIYFALKKNYLAAGLFALACSATHITGMFVVLLMAMILLEEHVKKSKIVLAFAVGIVGLVSYMYFLWDRFGQPLAFITSQEGHGWLKYGDARLINSIDLFNVIFIVLLIISVVYWRQRRKSFSVYSMLFLLIPLIGKQFGGYNRYVLMAFPLQLMLYNYLRHKKIGYVFAIALISISWSYFLFQYAGGYIGG
jgi:Gpi18-like mannosyltransferase